MCAAVFVLASFILVPCNGAEKPADKIAEQVAEKANAAGSQYKQYWEDHGTDITDIIDHVANGLTASADSDRAAAICDTIVSAAAFAPPPVDIALDILGSLAGSVLGLFFGTTSTPAPPTIEVIQEAIKDELRIHDLETLTEHKIPTLAKDLDNIVGDIFRFTHKNVSDMALADFVDGFKTNYVSGLCGPNLENLDNVIFEFATYVQPEVDKLFQSDMFNKCFSGVKEVNKVKPYPLPYVPIPCASDLFNPPQCDGDCKINFMSGGIDGSTCSPTDTTCWCETAQGSGDACPGDSYNKRLETALGLLNQLQGTLQRMIFVQTLLGAVFDIHAEREVIFPATAKKSSMREIGKVYMEDFNSVCDMRTTLTRYQSVKASVSKLVKYAPPGHPLGPLFPPGVNFTANWGLTAFLQVSCNLGQSADQLREGCKSTKGVSCDTEADFFESLIYCTCLPNHKDCKSFLTAAGVMPDLQLGVKPPAGFLAPKPGV